jgi:hypothetical protein
VLNSSVVLITTKVVCITPLYCSTFTSSKSEIMFIEPIIFFLAAIMPYNNSAPDSQPEQKKVYKEVQAKDKDQNTSTLLRGGWDRN